MVDLRAKPYCLSGWDAAWVKAVIASMSDEEKAGQLLFCGNAAGGGTPQELVEQYHIGGCHCAGLPSRQVREFNRALQTAADIPLFLACGTQSGGSGAATDGTYIANGWKIAATGRPQYARELGFLANEEAAAMGNNMAFAPLCALHPGGGSAESAQQAAELGAAYVAGVHDLPGFASVCRCCLDDGDGKAVWEGVYRALIDAGVDGVMVAGDGCGRDPDWAPDGLLRGRLGFRGVVICDTAPMTGGARGELMAAAINGGCDMLLCSGGVEENFQRVLAACRDGAISEARLSDALTRILGLKARMGLHRRARTALVPSAAALTAILGAPKYKAAAEMISRDALTLVRCGTPELLPLRPEKYRRIVLADVSGPDDTSPPDNSPAELLCQRLRDKGFDAAAARIPGEGGGEPEQGRDLVLLMSGAERFELGGEEAWLVPGVPAIGIIGGAPAAPSSAPALDALINIYDAQPLTLDVLVEKLLTGPEAFRGSCYAGSRGY